MYMFQSHCSSVSISYNHISASLVLTIPVLSFPKALSRKCALQENTMLKLDQQFAEMFH